MLLPEKLQEGTKTEPGKKAEPQEDELRERQGEPQDQAGQGQGIEEEELPQDQPPVFPGKLEKGLEERRVFQDPLLEFFPPPGSGVGLKPFPFPKEALQREGPGPSRQGPQGGEEIVRSGQEAKGEGAPPLEEGG